MKKSLKRSARVIITSEARVLRDLRIQAKLSMRAAGERMGFSDSYIAHIETGRSDVPKGDKLDRILSAYGGIKQKSFYERVRSYIERPDDIALLQSLIESANLSQREKIKKYMEAIMAGII